MGGVNTKLIDLEGKSSVNPFVTYFASTGVLASQDNLPIKNDQTNIVELIDLSPSSNEFKWVKKSFHNGVNKKVIKVSVVYNKALWDNYSQHKSNHPELKEIFLYHGTKSNSPLKIYTEGLKIQYCVSGGLFFGVSSALSDRFTHSTGSYNQIFMCRILVPGIIESSDRYVVNNDDYHYPQYLISYSR